MESVSCTTETTLIHDAAYLGLWKRITESHSLLNEIGESVFHVLYPNKTLNTLGCGANGTELYLKNLV
jgi:hypothetical protein